MSEKHKPQGMDAEGIMMLAVNEWNAALEKAAFELDQPEFGDPVERAPIIAKVRSLKRKVL